MYSDFGLVRRELELAAGTVPVMAITARAGMVHSFGLFRKTVDLFVGQGDLVMLTGPVDWQEVRERHGNTPVLAPENETAALWRYNHPSGLAHSLGEGLACVELNSLHHDGPQELITVNARGVVVPPDQRVARMQKGEQLFVQYPDHFPLVIGSEEAVSMLCSYASGEHPPTIHRTGSLRRDFSAFGRLWQGAAPGELLGIEGLLAVADRWADLLKACGIGKSLGGVHSAGMLRVDGHAGNYIVQMLDAASLIDFDEDVSVIPELTVPQRANDVAPLLPDMDRAQWLAFRAGYLHTCPSGQAVVDFMERGDATGWMRAVREGDWERALELADADLGTRDGAAGHGPDSRVAAARAELARRELADLPALPEDELALAFAQAMSLTGQDRYAATLYSRVVAERAERLGPEHPDTRAAAAAQAMGLLLSMAPDGGTGDPACAPDGGTGDPA